MGGLHPLAALNLSLSNIDTRMTSEVKSSKSKWFEMLFQSKSNLKNVTFRIHNMFRRLRELASNSEIQQNNEKDVFKIISNRVSIDFLRFYINRSRWLVFDIIFKWRSYKTPILQTRRFWALPLLLNNAAGWISLYLDFSNSTFDHLGQTKK